MLATLVLRALSRCWSTHITNGKMEKIKPEQSTNQLSINQSTLEPPNPVSYTTLNMPSNKHITIKVEPTTENNK